jgi:hypothetical protein
MTEPQQLPLDFTADITANYHRGNPQSQAAHESIKGVKRLLRAEVVASIDAQARRGATCEETEQRLDRSHQSVSARITEAKARHELVDSGARRPTTTGRGAAVYVTPRWHIAGS